MPSATDLILHQYDVSPFSEKARIMLGLKGLDWFACNQSVIMPKPELIALTGGYRQIPVLQIGADIFCGTELIADELETRFPAPSLYPKSGAGLGRALSYWTDETLFRLVVELVFGSGDFKVDDDFLEDRSRLIRGRFDIAAMAAAFDANVGRLRAHLELVERQLADGRRYLLGDVADMADINLYHVVDFMTLGRGKIAKVVGDFAGVLAWQARVAAIGHGRRQETSRQSALAAALGAKPSSIPASTYRDGPQPGDKVRFVCGAASSSDVEGELVQTHARRIAILRSAPEVGEVVTHLPRDAGWFA